MMVWELLFGCPPCRPAHTLHLRALRIEMGGAPPGAGLRVFCLFGPPPHFDH